MSFARRIASAIQAHEALPPRSELPPLTLDDAYALQAEVFRAVSSAPPAGIKAGVTSDSLQKLFNIDHALLGRLYHAGRLKSGAELRFLPGKLIECEVGVIVDGRGNPIALCPALEFAFVRFSEPGDASAAYLTAANVAADQFMTGDESPWQPPYDDLRVTLYHNGEPVNQAAITESLDGPEAAANWVVAEAGRVGIDIADRCLLMTGACGKVIPVAVGDYLADYGPLGQLSFSVVDT